MTNDIRELNVNELEAVSGGVIYEAIQQIIGYVQTHYVMEPVGSGSGSGDGLGSGGMGSGSGRPTCPGCHGPA